MYLDRIDKRGQKVRLDDIPTGPPKGLTREDAREQFDALGERLFALQDLMWGAKTHSVMVVLQGRDSAGKDGAIKHVVGCLNPRGVAVTSFGVPTEEERQHDFLWRVHRHAPRGGETAIFNRSHYEDVLVVRVHDLVPESVWRARYAHINAFEALLADAGTIVLKYFLHISKDEQKERLLEREEDPQAAWKLNVGDWKDRAHWDEYTEAYEDALRACASKQAPWLVVPADAKWFRNLAIAESLVKALEPYAEEWEETLARRGDEGRRALAEFRAQKAAKRAKKHQRRG